PDRRTRYEISSLHFRNCANCGPFLPPLLVPFGQLRPSDTHPRTEHLQNPTDHHRRESQRRKAFFTGDAQAACRCNCWGSKPTPFFHIVKVIAAIFRATVRRAMVGRIPFSTRARPSIPPEPLTGLCGLENRGAFENVTAITW